jgi:hypothetical protein
VTFAGSRATTNAYPRAVASNPAWKSFVCLLLLALTPLGCDRRPQQLEFVEFGTPSSDERIELESMVAILARPEDFGGKRVKVQGVFNLEFEGDQLCLDRDSLRHFVLKNCLRVRLNPGLEESYEAISRWNGWYAMLEGEISAEDRGHFGMFRASVVDVSHILIVRTERRF